MRRLLGLELSLDGVDLAEDADLRLAYEAAPCAAGATAFTLTLERGGEPVRASVDVAEVPLGSVPRALALEMAEMVRGRGSVSSAPVSTAEVATSDAEPADAEPEAVPPTPSARVTAAPVERAPAEREPAELDSPEDTGPPLQLGAQGSTRNTPDTGGLLAGARLFVDLPLAHGVPLTVRADAAALFGQSAHDVVLGWVEGGLTVAILAQAVAELGLRFGPRVWIGYGFVLDTAGQTVTRASDAVQVGVGVVVGVEIDLNDGLRLAIGAEVGSNLHGLELTAPPGRSGYFGAYWGADVGLAFAL